jgi:hypothetical protein
MMLIRRGSATDSFLTCGNWLTLLVIEEQKRRSHNIRPLAVDYYWVYSVLCAEGLTVRNSGRIEKRHFDSYYFKSSSVTTGRICALAGVSGVGRQICKRLVPVVTSTVKLSA